MNIETLLKRTTLRIPLERYISVLQQKFPQIRPVKNYEPIYEGYEDANFLLKTDTGKYVLKIFAKFRSEKNIHDYIKVLEQAPKIGVQTLEPLQSDTGKNYFFYDNTYSIVTEYFPGKDYSDKTPTLQEMLDITKNISILNTLDFDVDPTYDSWGNNNLLNEYSNTKVQNDSVKEELIPIIDYLKNLDTYKFSTGVIHADMQRKHVLKDDNRYCIIDFGCMRNDLKVYELSVFLAWFCLGEDTWEDREKILKEVLEEYTKNNRLTEKEILSIKPLIVASYAAYYLKTQELIEQGDDSKETEQWNLSAKELYRKGLDWVNPIKN